LKKSLLPPNMWILLAGASLAWIGVLSLAFMAVAGAGVSATSIFAGSLFFFVAGWVGMLAREFQQAVFHPAPALDDSEDDSQVLAARRYKPDRLRSKLADHRECILPRDVAVAPRRSLTVGERKPRRMARPNRTSAH
jgi:hypothetical protein